MFNYDTKTVNANIMALAEALKVAGAQSATLCYSGAGDSGDITEMNVAWPENHKLLATSVDEALGDVSYYQVSATFTGTGFKTSKSAQTANFSTAISDIGMQTVAAAGHLGWENNEGSSGTLTVFATGYAELSHVDNIIESEETVTDFGPDDDYRDSIDQIVEYLKKSGAVNMTASYYGSYGDRMVDTVRVNWPDDIAASHNPAHADSAGSCAHAAIDPDVKKQTTARVEAVVDNFIWELTDYAGHDDFYEQDGGEGVLTITSAGQAQLVHKDFSDGEADPEVHYFGENVPEGAGDTQDE